MDTCGTGCACPSFLDDGNRGEVEDDGGLKIMTYVPRDISESLSVSHALTCSNHSNCKLLLYLYLIVVARSLSLSLFDNLQYTLRAW